MISRSLRTVLVLALAAQLACLPRITERCRLVTHPARAPALPAGLADLDALLLQRAADMTLAARHLDSSLVIVFRRDFAEVLLPALCERLEQARKLAMAGRTVEAGRKYQALLVSSQVLAFAVAMQSIAQYADRRLHAGGQISLTQEKFVAEAAPILTAALGEDPGEIERALRARPEVFDGWAKLLEGWPARIEDAAHRAKVAMVVWNVVFLMVAAYRAAGAAVEIAAAGRPPMPPLPAFAMAGGGVAASYSGTGALELVETLRKLIALGVLDAGVVAALSRPLMSARPERGDAAQAPGLPGVTNTINHIFGKEAHKLGGLVTRFGSREAAFNALYEATNSTVKARGTTGIFETVVDVGGQAVTVRGNVIEGVLRITTAYVP